MASFIAAAICLALPGLAAAAAPANDNFANAAQILGSAGSVSGSNAGATVEPGEPNTGTTPFAVGATVWYRWTAPNSGPTEVDLCGVGFAADLQVYTGATLSALSAPDSLTGSSCSPADTNSPESVFQATAGTVYFFRVGGVSDQTGMNPATGSFTLRLNLPPANDNLSSLAGGAFDVASSGPVTGENIGAAKESAENNHGANAGGHSVWYRWVAPVTATVRFDTCGSQIDTLLGVYQMGSTFPLTLVAGDDDAAGACPADQSSPGASVVQFQATAGTTYYVAVDGKDGAQGSFQLNLPPANDMFASTGAAGSNFDFNGLLASNVYSNRLATTEPGEPTPAGVPSSHSIWVQNEWPTPRPVIVSTCNSSIDTVLGVYTGATVNALTPVATNDDYPGCPGANPTASAVIFNAAANTVYHVLIAGKNGAEGNVIVSFQAPATNDNFANASALPLGGDGAARQYSLVARTLGATKEVSEPSHAGDAGGASLWWTYSPTKSGPVTLNTCGSPFDTLLAVYTGSSLAGLTPVVSNDDTSACGTGHDSAVSFNAVAGTVYRIAMDGKGGATGFGRLNVQPPSNDAFANATPLTGLTPIDIDQSLFGASTEINEPSPFPTFNFGIPTTWYSWVAPTNGTASVTTCPTTSSASNLQAEFSVYTGSTLGSLTRVVPANAFLDSCPGSSALGQHGSFTVTAGTTYELQLASTSFSPAHLHLDFTPSAPAAGPAGGTGSGATTTGGAAGPGPVPLASLASAGRATANRTNATVTLTCNGPAGSTCAISVAMTVTETLRGNTVVSVSARRKRNKNSRKVVTVGSATAVLAAGRSQTIQVPLAATGKALLAKRHRLSVTLIVRQGTGGSGRVVSTQGLTFAARKKH